ncbi:glycosyltransferase [Rhizobium sp. CFBP 8762]|uniref:glycosyltransferase n=1 Tax=Rhizobium sp. CFBP 8762 TaxID=2775279 RepID=UPI001783682A|nr:glycosyltransferase [Rhizobium sp. CFBP 8762]MBD8554007.1 glycosyltransferase [Rhizobium sp. CFBP 8762]
MKTQADPVPRYTPVVAIPAKNEEVRLPLLLRALNRQSHSSLWALPLRVILVLNNTTDTSASVVSALTDEFRHLDIRMVQIDFSPDMAHVGSARRMAMDTAADITDTGETIVLTSDADAEPDGEWVTNTLRAIAQGADAVGGHIFGDAEEEARLGVRFQERAALHARYSALCDELCSQIDPVAHDPWPRHHDHTGASIAVRADVYRAVGGMPALPFREDLAFISRVCASGYRLRHPMDMKVTVSARTIGRAPGGMADCVRTWAEDAEKGLPLLVACPIALEERLHVRRQLRKLIDEPLPRSLSVMAGLRLDPAVYPLTGTSAVSIAALIEQFNSEHIDPPQTVSVHAAITHLEERLSCRADA